MEINEINHYVCSGDCKTVSENPGNCYVSTCSRYGNPFVSCTCTDGKHLEVWSKDPTFPTDNDL